MILTVTDTVQTTMGPLAPLEIFDDPRQLYGFAGEDFTSYPILGYSGTQFMHSAMLLGLSSGTYATIPYDYNVLLADGDILPAHELTTGSKVAYFTRVMRHEKYAAMRIVPRMEDRVLEHRFVWECHAGMDVPKTHSVDHIDGDSYNNKYTNLRALDIRAHSRMTAQRQRNRHIKRNANGSFAKGQSVPKQEDKPIPEFLATGKVTGIVKVTSLEEATLEKHYFQWEIPDVEYLIMGNLCVQPA